MLSPEFYTLAHTYSINHNSDDDKLIMHYGYIIKNGKSLCLFSNNTPLLILSISYQQNDDYLSTENSFFVDSKCTKNNMQYFQNIFTKDNQYIEFVVTNLTEHHINFNIMKEAYNTDTNINEINELRPFETQTIKSDHSDGNRILKYASSIDSDDTINGDNDLYISVHMQKGIFYDDTHWESIDTFVIKETKNKIQRVLSCKYNRFAVSKPQLRRTSMPCDGNTSSGSLSSGDLIITNDTVFTDIEYELDNINVVCLSLNSSNSCVDNIITNDELKEELYNLVCCS